MHARGLEPDVITYNVTISAYEKGQQPERAIELLAEMLAHGLKSIEITYDAAISTCVKG